MFDTFYYNPSGYKIIRIRNTGFQKAGLIFYLSNSPGCVSQHIQLTVHFSVTGNIDHGDASPQTSTA